MLFRHGMVAWAIVGVAGGLAFLFSAHARAQTTSPPQQIAAAGAPAAYPPTSAAPYPTTDVATYPTTSPSPYPSTVAPADQTLASNPYVPNPYDGIASPAPAPLMAPPYGVNAGMPDAAYANPNAGMDAIPLDANAFLDRSLDYSRWTWSVTPEGLMYRSYLAGLREPRLGSQLVHDRYHGWYWDATVGGRAGILRYGTEDGLFPQGWQLDVEGAAFPRLDLENNEDLTDADFRGGVLLTTRQGWFESKFGFYHLSSHIGDEYLVRYPDYQRINYVRESLVFGVAVYPTTSLRLYSEAGWTFQEDGGARPWEFQFGADFCTIEPTGPQGAPFFAVNVHLRQENDFSGNLSVQTGWMWRGRTGHLFRIGMQYFNGMSDQYQFYDQYEEQIGGGIWYDF